MSVNQNAPIAQYTNEQLINQITNLPRSYQVPAQTYAQASANQLQNILLSKQTQMLQDWSTDHYGQGHMIDTLTGQVNTYRNIIVPTAITVAVASALVNLAIFYSYFNPASAVVGTSETCTKALTDCQTGLVTSKDLLEKCKGYIPTLKARRDEAMDDWEACLINLETYQNCTDATLATHADLLSRIEACNDTARNNTVN